MGISGHLVWMGISGKHLVWMGIILWGTWASCAAFDNREIHVLKRGNNSLVYDQVTTMAHRPAHFGPPIPSDGFRGVLVKAKPHGACGEVDPPPADPDMAWIAVIARGGCHCVEKVANAARAGYSAVIIHNVHNDEKAFEMRDEIGNTRVNISAVSVGYTEGRKLEDLYTHSADSRVVVEIYVNSLRTYIAHFIVPFSVIFVGFILICMFSKIKRTIIRLVQMCRTPQPDSTMELRERPFQKDEHHDTCSICLDHFKTGEKIRVLPCEHPYHRKCVDPWLMKHTPTCPMCKRSVLKSMFSINIEEAESHLDSMVEYIPVHDVQARPEDIASFHTESETSDSGNRRIVLVREAEETFKKAKEAFKEAKEAFKEAKEAFKKAKEAFKEAKEAFKEAKEAFKEAKEAFKKAKEAFKEAKEAFIIPRLCRLQLPIHQFIMLREAKETIVPPQFQLQLQTPQIVLREEVDFTSLDP
ncbi:hypothetical protein ACOMHN_047491 [Nucella lapillus]